MSRGLRAGLWSCAGLVVVIALLALRREAPERASAPRAEAHAARAAAIDSLERRGRLREALAVARADLADREAAGDPPSALADAWARLGGLHGQLGAHRDAVGALERARAVGGRELSRTQHAAILVTLAQAEKNAGLYDAAERHYDEALRLARAAGAAGRVLEARTRVGQAHLIRRAASERPRAAALLEEALGLFEREPSVTGDDLAATRSGLALVLLQIGEAARAESLLTHAVPATLAALGPEHPDVGLAHSLWGWSQYLLGRPRDAEASFRAAMDTYARARGDWTPGAARRRVMQRVALNLAAALLAQDRGDEAWAALEAGLSSYLAERLASRPPDATAADALRRAASVRERLQAALDPRTAVVGWVEVNLVNEPPRDAWAFVLRHDGPVRWMRLPAGGTGAAALQAVLHRDAGWSARVFDHDEATRAGHAAWRQRIAPLEPWLAGVEHVIAMNAWALTRVPIEAFVDDAGRALGDRVDVTYAPSAEAFLLLRDRLSPGPPGRALLVSDASAPREALPGSMREVARIAQLLESSVLAGPAARRLHALAAAGSLERYDVLHFATHATTDPRAAGGGALLLDADAALDGGDSTAIVTAADVETWRIDARLVSMSGCRSSGLPGFGSLEGMAEGFLVAGAAGVVVSLWDSDDRASPVLMARFYESLARHRVGGPIDAAAALREAQRALRDHVDADGRRPFRNPAYWAGFVYVGARPAASPLASAHRR